MREYKDYKKFEPWQEAHEITVAIFQAAHDHWKPQTAPLFEHLQKAAISVQTNIVQGCALAPRSFASRLTMAWGSSMETADLLETGMQEGILPGDMAMEALRRSKRCQDLLIEHIRRHMTS